MNRFVLKFLPLFFLFGNWNGHAQSYNYVGYTVRDGLAGNRVYDMIQDDLGFLWFGTDNGMSRFDGKHFRNYTIEHGLMDNEVLHFFRDYDNRIWVGTFSHELNYIKNGRVRNRNNDANLSNVIPSSRPLAYYQTNDSTLWIICQKQIFKYPKGGYLQELAFSPSLWERVKNSIVHGEPYSIDKNLTITFNDSIFIVKDNRLDFFRERKMESGLKKIQLQLFKQDTSSLYFKHDVIKYTSKNGSPHFISTMRGAYEYNYYSGKVIDHYLPEKVVTSSIQDIEGNHWFSTLGDGVYKLASKNALNYSLTDNFSSFNEVFAIGSRNDTTFTGHGESTIALWKKGKLVRKIDYRSYLKNAFNNVSINRVRSIIPLKDGSWLFGFDAFLIWQKGDKQKFHPIAATKGIQVISEETALVATAKNAIALDLKTFRDARVLFNQRATCALFWKGEYYFGTLSGLYQYNNGRVRKLDSLKFELNRRITYLIGDSNSLWVATSDAGVVQINSKHKVDKVFNLATGLPSNNCRVLQIDGSSLWIGTNRGVAKIDLSGKPKGVKVYNQFNLLPDDAINSLYVNNGQVFVGSPAGLTIFDQDKVNNISICGLVIDRIKSSKRNWEETDTIKLNKNDNFLEIEFSGISSRAAGQIDYFFMLEGIDKKWQQTGMNVITYSTLSPGSYVFKLYARNRFGIKSAVKSFSVEVLAPFWRTRWFLALCLFLGLGFIFMVAYTRIRQRHLRLLADNKFQRQLAELEQKALQAQMNPHFIFNSLNSIQQYIFSNNQLSANKYLTIFASLIRETLENSSQGFISIRKEITYLSKYLELEQLRFGMRFSYKIHAEDLLNLEDIMVPVMLLQPFVENAVRHGIRYRLDGHGEINISFLFDNNVLQCFIEDNGPGRAKTTAYKSFQHIEYQSRGMELTQKRIYLLNKIYGDRISFDISDIEDERGLVTGTRVHLLIAQNHGQ